MKSLQVVTPHIDCIFNCPFCIARCHSHQNRFINLYKEDFLTWKNNLINIINNNPDLKTVVITGTNESMQTPDCIRDIIDIVRLSNSSIQIELQTRMYKENKIYKDLDVVSYSVDNFNYLDKIKGISKINRLVILLTKSFDNKNLNDILIKIDKSINQLTFKVLQDSNGYNKRIDNWIKDNRCSTINVLKEDVNNYHGNISVFFDENCMDSHDRYMIYREDGKLYEDWEEKA